MLLVVCIGDLVGGNGFLVIGFEEKCVDSLVGRCVNDVKFIVVEVVGVVFG